MLEKTVLQQLQEIFPMEVNREQADTGEKIRLRMMNKKQRQIFFLMDSWNKGMDIRIQKPIIEMSMKQVIFQNMAIKRMKNKSKKL